MIDAATLERGQNFIEFLCYEVYWGEAFLFTFFMVIIFILDQKFDIKKPRKLFLACNGLIFQRIFSMLAYYVPYIELLNTLIPTIKIKHPYLVRLVMPDFIADSMTFIEQIPFLPVIYLAIAYGGMIRYRNPKDRFLRFNIMYGIVIMYLLGIFQELFLGTIAMMKTAEAKAELGIILYIVWMAMTFVPCFVNAFLGRYTSNKFMREAIEVHLGRDSADFVWWDRRGDKNDNRPKKPKKPNKPNKPKRPKRPKRPKN